MSAKKLYERLVEKLLAHWMVRHPMQEWIGPEEAVDRFMAEFDALQKAYLDLKFRMDGLEK